MQRNDKIDKILKEKLKKEFSNSSLFRTENCPEESVLLEYLYDDLPKGKSENIREHIQSCIFCTEAVSSIQRWKEQKILQDFLDVPSDSINRIKDKVCHKEPGLISKIKKQKWLIVSIILFGLSFLVKRYFFQFLFAALIFGIKWAFFH